MIIPRYVVAWGELLKQKRNNAFDLMNSDEKCTAHLRAVGQIDSFDIEAGNVYWHEILNEQCDSCPHKETCRLYISEE